MYELHTRCPFIPMPRNPSEGELSEAFKDMNIFRIFLTAFCKLMADTEYHLALCINVLHQNADLHRRHERSMRQVPGTAQERSILVDFHTTAFKYQDSFPWRDSSWALTFQNGGSCIKYRIAERASDLRICNKHQSTQLKSIIPTNRGLCWG